MNHFIDLVTEEHQHTGQCAPKTIDTMSGSATWYGRPIYYQIFNPNTNTPTECVDELQSHIMDLWYDEAVYDYLVAVQGDITAVLPGKLQHLHPEDYTMKSTGVAYFSTVPTERDAGGLTKPLLHETVEYLDLPEWEDEAYNYVTAVQGDLSATTDSPLPRPDNLVVTIAGNLLSGFYGVVTALQFSAAECGMSLDCLAAMECYNSSLANSTYRYETAVEALADRYTLPGKYFPVAHKYGMSMDCVVAVVDYLSSLDSEERRYSFCVQSFAIHGHVLPVWASLDGFCEEGSDDEYDDEYDEYDDEDEDLLVRPPVQRVDPEAFVSKLDEIDISSVLADDMKCFHCWNRFGETDDGMIELCSGERAPNNDPVRMPCGHLIGRTCLMQLVDADDRLRPLCRKDIVAMASGMVAF